MTVNSTFRGSCLISSTTCYASFYRRTVITDHHLYDSLTPCVSQYNQQLKLIFILVPAALTLQGLLKMPV